MLKTCLLGLGRTGAVVAEQLAQSPEHDLVSVIAKPGGTKAGRQLADFINTKSDLVINSSDNLLAEINQKQFKVAIDFTSAEATLTNARLLAENGVHLVIGATGFNNMQLYDLRNLAQKYKIGLVYAPNISLGINLLLTVVKTISRLIPDYDVEIVESHHRHKKDSPSGTALKIAAAIKTAKGKPTGNLMHGRKGNHSRETDEIGVHAIRAGGIVGVHQVLFAGESDEIEITHRSYSRVVFAEGALRAAKFISNRKGFFGMEDVLREDCLDSEEPNLPDVLKRRDLALGLL